jgi:hypothetical protein
LGLVDTYTLAPGAVDQLTGAQRPLRGRLRG